MSYKDLLAEMQFASKGALDTREISAIRDEILEGCGNATFKYEDVDEALHVTLQAFDMLLETKERVDATETLTVAEANAYGYAVEVIGNMSGIPMPYTFSAEEGAASKPKHSLGDKIENVMDTVIVKIKKLIKMLAEALKNRFGKIARLSKAYDKKWEDIKDKSKTGNIKLSGKVLASLMYEKESKVDFGALTAESNYYCTLEMASKMGATIKKNFEAKVAELNKAAEEGKLEKLRSSTTYKSDGSTVTNSSEYVTKMAKTIMEIFDASGLEFTSEKGHIKSQYMPGGLYFSFDTKSEYMSIYTNSVIVASLTNDKTIESTVPMKDVLELFENTKNNLAQGLKRYKDINKELTGLEDYVTKTIKGAKFTEFTNSPAQSASLSYGHIRKANSIISAYISMAGKIGSAIYALG